MTKTIVEDCRKVETWWLKKYQYLNGFKWGGIEWTNGYSGVKNSINIQVDTNDLYIRFMYTKTDYYTDEKTDMDYRFNLTTTQCNYGGVRYWFICGLYSDGRYCGRRVGVLYKPPNGKWFGCHHCWDLSYDERQKNRGGKYGALFRTLDIGAKADKLEEGIKRRFWRGRPTRKYRRLLKYDYAMRINVPLIKSFGA